MRSRPLQILLLFTCALLSPRPLAAGQCVVVGELTAALPGGLSCARVASDRPAEIWLWDADSAPVMASVENLPADPWSLLGSEDTRRLRVGVHGDGIEIKAGETRVITAPREMWRTIPEDLLPSYPMTSPVTAIPAGAGVARIRVVGPRYSSDWENVDEAVAQVDLSLVKAADVALVMEGEREKGETVSVTLMRWTGTRVQPVLTFYQTDHHSLQIPAVPAALPLQLIIASERFAPTVIRGRGDELTRTITLRRGLALTGRFVDEEGRPLAGIEVTAESWMAHDVDGIARRTWTTDARGRWTIRALPVQEVSVEARGESWATWNHVVHPENATEREVDLGEQVLKPVEELRLLVLDSNRKPVKKARVSEGRVDRGVTGNDGRVTIELPQGAGAKLRISARGFGEANVELASPFRRTETVILESDFEVKGQLVDARFEPIREGSVKVEVGRSYRTVHAAEDGSFALFVPPNERINLVLASPSSISSAVEVEPGHPGESRDLGQIVLDEGWKIRGQLLSPSRQPIAGARVWALRHRPNGPAAAWLEGAMTAAETGEDGMFVLRGLSAGPVRMRLDARGMPPEIRDLVLEEVETDLGAIVMERGGAVTVEVDAAGHENAIARIDLTGEWLEHEMLTAAVVSGSATIRDVPPGSYTLSVIRGFEVLCEKTVQVQEDEITRTRCGRGTDIIGRVFAGGEPVDGGWLTWSPGNGTKPQAVLVNKLSPLGAMRQDVFGLGRGPRPVEVDSAGFFHLEGMTPGEWSVTWFSPGAGATPPQSVFIPEVPRHEVNIRLEGDAILGRVVDEDGRPVENARIRDLDATAVALSDAAGRFTFVGVGSGDHRLEARLGSRSSEIATVTIGPDTPRREVILIVRESDATLRVAVHTASGAPASGAFVFVDSSAGGRILTADRDGIATQQMLVGERPGGPVSAFHQGSWAFGLVDGCETSSENCRVTVRMPRNPARISVRGKGESLNLYSSTGADIAWLMSRLGWTPPTSSSELEIGGLPPGRYTVVSAGSTKVVDLEAGSVSTIEIP